MHHGLLSRMDYGLTQKAVIWSAMPCYAMFKEKAPTCNLGAADKILSLKYFFQH